MPAPVEPNGGRDLPALREMIAAYGLSARKSLGQNFLLDLNLTRRIARAAGPLENTTVCEIGPGPGGLTRALLTERAARVIAIERDERCIAILAEIARAFSGRLEIIPGDALTLDEKELLRTRNIVGPVRVAANLPYNIASALLVKWLTPKSWPPFWASLTLMFQREVAERLVAEPGSRNFGRLSVLTQWRTQARILFDVHPRAFTPPPKVNSAVVRIEPRPAPLAEARLEDLEAITKAAFGQRRKMLRQSLKSVAPDSEALIRSAGLDPTERAERLSVEQFAALARARRELVEGVAGTCKADKTSL